MFLWILIFQGVILSCAWGCGLEDVCRAGGIRSETVDPFSDIEVSAQCSNTDSSWYIRRYTTGNNSLDGLGAPVNQNDSFRQIGNELTMHNIDGFSEGTYHCGTDADNIQPASLCLFVRGQPVFASCPDEYEGCSLITDINDDASIDTRVIFNNGGFCDRTKKIRSLRVSKNQEIVYFCSNLTTFSIQLCNDTEKFRVEQQQPCTEPDITLCKYNMRLKFLTFGQSDEGIYNVIIEFENDGLERGMLMRQFNVTLSPMDGPTNNNEKSSTTELITLPNSKGGGLSGGIIAAIVIAIVITIVIAIFIAIVIVLLITFKKKLKPVDQPDAPPSSEFQFRGVIRGCHANQKIWTPVLGEELAVKQEPTNQHDKYAMAVVQGKIIVGHVPREISKQFYRFIFIDDDNEQNVISCKVTGKPRPCPNILQATGLEAPCVYTIKGKEQLVKILKKQFKN